jgi:hypothetical protein
MNIVRDKKFVFPLTLVLLFLGFIVFFNKLSWTLPTNSDFASIILEAESFLYGNLFLSGWTLTNISFYTTDLPFYVLGMLIEGFTPKLMHHVPAAQYSFMVIASLWLVQKNKVRLDNWKGSLIIFIILALPSDFMMLNSLMGPMHMGTLVYLLLAFIFIDKIEESMRPKARMYLFSLFMSLACIGDTLALFIGVLPVCIISLLEVIIRNKSKKIHLPIICLSLFCVVISKAFDLFISSVGGYSIVYKEMRFANFQDIDRNLSLTVEGLIKLYGSDFFGQPLNFSTFSILLHFLILLYTTYILFSQIVSLIKKDTKTDYVSQILAVSSVILLIAYTFSDLALNIYTSRYLVPIVIFGSIILGRSVQKNTKALKYVLPFLGIVFLCFFVSHYPNTQPVTPQKELQNFLTQQNLKNGYASFWNSNIITVESEGTVKVRAIEIHDRKLTPVRWFSNDEWFKHPANFIIVQNSVDTSVNVETLTVLLGQPAHIHAFGDYTVFVWSEDISKKLTL